MNKHQRKKHERQKPPWEGRFSHPPNKSGEELYVVYVARPVAGNTVRHISEELIIPYTPESSAVLGYCRELVDSFLAESYEPEMTPEELFRYYRQKGPDPYIRYEERGISEFFTNSKSVPFNAWGYAECACRRLYGREPGEPSRSLALLQGRYQEFDRKQMLSQLLLWRHVRLTRDCQGMVGTFPAGTEGTIGMHVYYVDASCFNWSVELPVIFDVNDGRGQVTFGVPYDAMAFVESDVEYLDKLTKRI